MTALVLNFLRPYLFQIALYGGIALAATGGFVAAKIHYENVGYAKAIAAVAAQDKGALDAVRDAKGKVDQCYVSGRSWDVVNGVCG